VRFICGAVAERTGRSGTDYCPSCMRAMHAAMLLVRLGGFLGGPEREAAVGDGQFQTGTRLGVV
jgi:hypothetical protein